MENLFEKIYPYAFTRELDFMFAGEYCDGTFLFEFNPETHGASYISDIIKNKLLRFGMVGEGLRAYFNTFDGKFMFDGNEIEIIYKTKDKEYLLMNPNEIYNDIIYYKNAYSTVGRADVTFCGYNLGYKKKIQFDDGTYFYFKPILHIPLDQPMNFTIGLTANKDLDGDILIRVNKFKTYNMYAPLDKNIHGELTWIIKK